MKEKFKERIESNLEIFSSSIDQIELNLPLSTAWLANEISSSPSIPARSILEGAKISYSELAVSWALGLNRGAAASLRSYCECLVSWLYYKDHGIEFDLVKRLRSDLKLPKAVQSYLKEIDAGFEKSYQFLKLHMKRSDEYYYTNLSAFAHAHPNFVLHGKSMDEIVVSYPVDDNFFIACTSIDEFISDQFSVHYRHSWGSIPIIVQDNLKIRLGSKLSDFQSVPD